MELLKKLISGWVRQSRWRARRLNIDTNVSLPEIYKIYEDFEFKCAYCGKDADSPDHPFPIKDKAPCVAANVLPCCDGCRKHKKNRHIVKFYQDGNIPEQVLHELIRRMLKYSGGDKLREYIKQAMAQPKPETPPQPTPPQSPLQQP